MDRNSLVPDIKFVSLPKGLRECDLFEYLNQDDTVFVWLRCKYKNDTKWEYIVDACTTGMTGEIVWFSDWWEGQEEVEYLAVTQIER